MMKVAIRRASRVLPSRSFGASFTRDPRFAQVESSDISTFENIVGTTGVLTEQSDTEFYKRDWLQKYEGKGSVVLLPSSTEQVSQILKHCNDRKLAIVPQGGNTGLCAGAIPIFDEVVMSMSRMNKVLDFDALSGIVTTEAGVVLENLNNYLTDRKFIVPLDLGAKGSCQIGGNVSTNAGGLRFLRYGSLHGNVLGLEAVMADGTILDNLATMRKDNTGYDLKQMFIGSEGSLGVITKVSLLCPRQPQSVQVIMLALDSYEKVLETMSKARADLSEILSACEFMDRPCMEVVTEYIPELPDPFTAPHPFYMVIETSGSNEDHDSEKLMSFLDDAQNAGLVDDGVLASSDTQAKQLWGLREGIALALMRKGYMYKYDLSMPVSELYNCVLATRERLEGTNTKTLGYGHLGDGNLHLNISVPAEDPEVEAALEPFVYDFTAKYRGSVSAEHGMGQTKTQYMHLSKSTPMISLMRQTKQMFDPNGILNPYKVLPQQ